MNLKLRLVFTALTAAMALSLAVGTGQADELEVNEQEFRAIWAPLEFRTPLGPVNCPVTLLGRFHSRTIVKTAGALVGSITSATVNDAGCAGGGAGTSGNGATVLAETLPWLILYLGFSGELPNIDLVEVALINAAFQIDTGFPDGLVCLARTTTTEPALGNIEIIAGQADTLTANEEAVIDANDIGAGTSCDGLAVDGEFAGTGNVTTPAGGLIFVTLV